jgi:hypothetical protein
VPRLRSGLAIAATGAGLLVAGGALAVASTPGRQSAHPTPGSQPVAHAANSSGLTVSLTGFTQTSAGTTHGQAVTGVKGKGTFTARLGVHARLIAALASAATGIPFTKIVHGGRYGIEQTLGATGTNTGIVVAKFKAHGLGAVCFKFTARGGQFQQGDSFVPTSGSIRVLGGSGAAAHWSGHASFSVKNITGVANYVFAGTAHGSVGGSHGISAACRRVAALA